MSLSYVSHKSFEKYKKKKKKYWQYWNFRFTVHQIDSIAMHPLGNDQCGFYVMHYMHTTCTLSSNMATQTRRLLSQLMT